ncbi:MAG TPA: hypothetical protein VGA22_02860 [Gemmatimonadales bacterium]
MRNFFAMIGCATLLVALAVAAWFFRAELRAAYAAFREPQAGAAAPATPPAVASSTGSPSADALGRAEEKEAAIGDAGGPGYVAFTAEEFASLVAARLDPAASAAMDSLTITLSENRVVLGAQMRLDLLGRDLLGPLADLLGGRQPFRAEGPLTVRAPGVLAWSVEELVIREFPLPGSVIPRVVERLAGDSTGAFLLPAPATVGDVRVQPDGIVFYRRVP